PWTTPLTTLVVASVTEVPVLPTSLTAVVSVLVTVSTAACAMSPVPLIAATMPFFAPSIIPDLLLSCITDFFLLLNFGLAHYEQVCLPRASPCTVSRCYAGILCPSIHLQIGQLCSSG